MATIGYGLIGAGSFGQFCLEQYRQMEQVDVRAIADVDPQAAKRAARAQGVDAAESVQALLQRDDIDLVHIATPPFTHRDLAVQALEADKHVLCEKPLAITGDDADAMVDLARKRGRILAVNLIMRYNPLAQAVHQVIEQRLLGEPLHGFFENYAKDEPLPVEHWFWDRSKSGGIFIEHGVHFFDLMRNWFGDGHVVCAQQTRRPGTDIIDQVQCTVRHVGGVCVNHYHGFTQPSRMDRQEFRIVCERGSIRLFEWVPTRAEIDCLATEQTLDQLRSLLPDMQILSQTKYDPSDRQVTGRHKPFQVDGRYRLQASPGMDKPALYGHVVRSLLADQIAAIDGPEHTRRITEDNALTSLRDALRAQALAD